MQYHAYYIEGSTTDFNAYRLKLKPLYAQNYERFGIDEARKLIDLALLKNFKETVFLVSASSITSEAQQALLKLFEEPQSGTAFVLMIPPGVLLPTLKSRMLEYPDRIPTDLKSGEAKLFLKLAGKERSDFITKLLKDEEGLKERVRDFVNGLEVELAKDIKKNTQALADIAVVRDYLSDRAPSLKMLFEHLALSLPII